MICVWINWSIINMINVNESFRVSCHSHYILRSEISSFLTSRICQRLDTDKIRRHNSTLVYDCSNRYFCCRDKKSVRNRLIYYSRVNVRFSWIESISSNCSYASVNSHYSKSCQSTSMKWRWKSQWFYL